jgi:hypothetical protein
VFMWSITLTSQAFLGPVTSMCCTALVVVIPIMISVSHSNQDFHLADFFRRELERDNRSKQVTVYAPRRRTDGRRELAREWRVEMVLRREMVSKIIH